MASDIIERLKNDPEFVKRVADAVSSNAILSKLNSIENKVDYLLEMNKLVWEKFAENDKKFNEMLVRIEGLREDLIRLQERHDAEMERMRKEFEEREAKHDANMERMRKEFEEREARMTSTIKKDIKAIRRTIENLTISLEDEAMDFLANKLRKEHGKDTKVVSLNLQGIVEVHVYAEAVDWVIVGEVKLRAGEKAVRQLEDSVKRLLKARPELSKKRVIKMIYAKKVTSYLIEECRRRDIYLTNGVSDVTSLAL